VIGASVGAVVLLCCLILIVIFVIILRRRRRNRPSKAPTDYEIELKDKEFSKYQAISVPVTQPNPATPPSSASSVAGPTYDVFTPAESSNSQPTGNSTYDTWNPPESSRNSNQKNSGNTYGSFVPNESGTSSNQKIVLPNITPSESSNSQTTASPQNKKGVYDSIVAARLIAQFSIPYSKLKIERELGRGNFGIV